MTRTLNKTNVRNLSTSSITGTTVYNHQNETIGDIQDMMVDLETGKIRYAVLDFGGLLGIGNKLFAIPFDAFKVDAENERFILNVDKEILKQADGFDKDNWPDFANRQFEQRLHDYYGVKPYWN